MKKHLLIAVALISFSATTHAKNTVLDCENQYTTLDINQCAMIELQALEAEQAKYLTMSFKNYGDDAEWVTSMKTVQKDWETYKLSHCGAAYDQWGHGSIRNSIFLSCQKRLTKQRTHEIWSEFLTSIGSTPPLLPEPAK